MAGQSPWQTSSRTRVLASFTPLCRSFASGIFGIIAGYEDQNDHDSLRSDPVFKLIAEQPPDGDDLASQPTISRLENSVTAGDLLKMEDWFIDRFVESFTEVPAEITLNIDTFDDPVHDNQQLVFFHGFYNQYQPDKFTHQTRKRHAFSGKCDRV